MEARQHVALFGGTFNPIHNGHLVAAREAADRCRIDKVIFIPSYLPPHRVLEQQTPAKHRFEMVRLACEGLPLFDVSDFESRRTEKSYSLITIRHFKQSEKPGTKISFLIGTDAFAELYTWHRVSKLLAACDFLVMKRPGKEGGLADVIPKALKPEFSLITQEKLIHASGKTATLVPIEGLTLSSSQVRKTLTDKGQALDLLPAQVMNYIRRNSLYGVNEDEPA